MKQKPFFTIVIPTYRRFDQLGACLRSISCMDYPRDDFEVVIVDDGSPAPPESIVESYKSQLNVRLIVQPHAGPATARNRGVSEASGAFIAFTDDDCMPAPDWLAKLGSRLDADPGCIVAGNTVNTLTDNPYSTASQMLIDYLNAYYNKERARFLTSNNMALAKDVFIKIGGFDTSFPLAAAEDREFCDRCVHNGLRTVFASEAVVRHAHSLTFGRFLRQHYNYGRGANNFHRIRAERTSEKMKIEPPRFYIDLLLHPWKSEAKNKTYLAFLMFLSQAANAAGLFCEKLGNRGAGVS
ncbi:MAG: glycosyltransferase [Candidatus Dadabacteria bacterium]|nr:glycosyltransferase [Candidatus Dadabacteria bacterium]